MDMSGEMPRGRAYPPRPLAEPQDSPAPKASGWVSAKHELRSSRKAPSGRCAGCKSAAGEVFSLVA